MIGLLRFGDGYLDLTGFAEVESLNCEMTHFPTARDFDTMTRVSTLFEAVRAAEVADFSGVRSEVAAVVARYGAVDAIAFREGDPAEVVRRSLDAVAASERSLAQHDTSDLEARAELELRSARGWWFLLGALVLSGVVIVVGQQVF